MSDSVETARERLFRIVNGEFRVRRGHPLPYGASARREGVNFSVFSRHATAMSLVLFAPGETESVLELPLDPRYNKTGEVWHVFVEGIDPGIEYGFRADCRPNPAPDVLRFDPGKVLLDPYSKSVAGLETWGEVAVEKGRLERLRSRVVDEEFDWGHEHPLAVPLADSVIYEVHVRGFTRHPSSGVAHPGTFRGVVEKIPYLAGPGGDRGRADAGDGVRGVRQPAHEPPHRRAAPQLLGLPARVLLRARRPPTPRAARRPKRCASSRTMVKALHEAGIEVILDIVFNHTGEGDEKGADLLLPRPRQPDLLPPRAEDGPLPELLGLREHPQLQPPGRALPDPRLRCATG